MPVERKDDFSIVSLATPGNTALFPTIIWDEKYDEEGVWMFRGKKLLSVLLSVLLVMGALVPVALADPPAFSQIKKVQVKKEPEIKDIKGHWAESVMMEMYAKGFIRGYEDFSFRPSNVVSNLETVVMLIRALGWEEEAKKTALTADFKHGKQIPSWAQGYVQVAYEKGLLQERDLKSFRPQQGTKRIEAAVYLARALGMDPEGEKDGVLSFFDIRDLAQEFREIISAMVKKGIMQGMPGKQFQPNKPITRAEMAVLLDRIDGKIRNVHPLEISGVIVAVGSESISLKTGSFTQKFLLDPKVTVYLDGSLADRDDLDVGNRAKLVFGDGGRVVYIKAYSSKEEQAYRGQIIQMVLGLDASITIDDGKKTKKFKVNPDTEVEVDGKEVFFTDLQIGQEVTVIAQGDLALVISSAETREKSVKGVLAELNLGKSNIIKVQAEDGKEIRLQVTDETRISLDGKPITDLNDLKPGYPVTVQYVGEKALRIQAETPAEKEYSGEIVRISKGKEPAVRLRISSKKDYDFKVTSTTRIYLDGDRVRLDELKPGFWARVLARADDALRIDAESAFRQRYRGKIVGLVFGASSSLTIETDQGRVYTFVIDQETEIYADEDRKGSLSDLELGQEVQIEVFGEQVLRINIV